ncbi:uncharacterized protein K441DRAFT_673656 [Cenococcum geophilum 1.58]|uniref:uncharacterized protein n=1 Tax=Cenococcum geophilum 1.58 TaxID=794803 RepID=UPI00358FC013|nr:hypothetical protein K441DRAFT_673656 [Cenococcum geophilum 1.58]
MPPKIDYAEAAVQKAMAAMDANPRLKGTTAAQQFGAPYDRLMARRRGRPASNTRGGHNKKLDVPQDQALRDYLMMLAGAGTEANLAEVKNAASRLLYYESGDPTKTVSRRWTKA